MSHDTADSTCGSCQLLGLSRFHFSVVWLAHKTCSHILKYFGVCYVQNHGHYYSHHALSQHVFIPRSPKAVVWTCARVEGLPSLAVAVDTAPPTMAAVSLSSWASSGGSIGSCNEEYFSVKLFSLSSSPLNLFISWWQDRWLDAACASLPPRQLCASRSDDRNLP